MKNWNRIIPYLSLGTVSVIVYILAQLFIDTKFQNILLGIFSNSIFFFIVYFFYDIIKQIVLIRERKYLDDYIKNKITNDIFVALYYLKKIIHGYNLETNTLDNIFSIVNYSKEEIKNSVKNQNYLGFQIFKNTDEVRSLFSDALNDNFILKYSSHMDSISILRITNNLVKLESILKTELNYEKSAEQGIEYTVINGKNINPENDDKYLLMKKTIHSDRFVVYDSGFFEDEKKDLLLNKYILNDKYSNEVSTLLSETFTLMKHWIPDSIYLAKNETRFRIIKDFFSPNTNSKTKKSKIFVADIVDISKNV